jgi:hypothetical protein
MVKWKRDGDRLTHDGTDSEQPVATANRDMVVHGTGVVGEAIDIYGFVTHHDNNVEKSPGK